MSKETNNTDADTRIKAMFDLFGTREPLSLEDVSVERALEIAEEISHVGIRDGVLHHFTKLTHKERKEYVLSVAHLSSVLEQRVTDPEAIAPVACFVIALDYLDIGFDFVDNPDDESLEFRLNNLDGLIDWLISEGHAPSLAMLIHRARSHDIPNNVFLESVQAVKYEEVLDSVKPLVDKEVEDDNAVVG